MKILPLLATVIAALPLAAAPKSPSQQAEAAMKKAAAEKKDVMMIFIATSWSDRSKNFNKEIIQNEGFRKNADGKFVSVVFDVPQKRADVHKDLLELRQKYRFNQLPTVILTDAQGRPYRFTGPKEDDPKKYFDHLADLHKVRVERDRLFAEAQKVEGHERASLLIKALKNLPQEMVRDFYSDELVLIAQADPKGKTGYVAEIEKAEALRKEQERYQMYFRQREFDKVIKESRAEAAKVKGEDAQRLRLYAIRALASQNKFDEASKEVELMAKLAPESELGKRAPEFLNSLKTAKERHAKMVEAAKNPKKPRVKGPSKPIVSKPVAIVTDINALRKDVQAAQDDAAKATQNELALKSAADASGKKLGELEGQLKEARAKNEKAMAALKKASAEREIAARKAQAMKDVLANHEAMEKRKRDIAELEKKASALQKQAEDLRKKASEIGKGK